CPCKPPEGRLDQPRWPGFHRRPDVGLASSPIWRRLGNQRLQPRPTPHPAGRLDNSRPLAAKADDAPPSPSLFAITVDPQPRVTQPSATPHTFGSSSKAFTGSRMAPRPDI